MGIFKQIWDWASDQVKSTTGEKERRELIEKLKECAETFKVKVTLAIEELNEIIRSFNNSIDTLNKIRTSKVKSNINTLHTFLNKFGHCKATGEYVNEEQKIEVDFPKQEFDSIENYIANVDWSQDEVFLNTFLLTPIGMKLKTRQQNLSLREHINQLTLQTEYTVHDLNSRKFNTEQEVSICKLYISNITFISDFIRNKIIPELELIEAFFQAEKIKDELLCEQKLEDVKFTYDIKSLNNSMYQKHYQFIKNAVAFYVISCKVFDTPVLTNLLANTVSDEDITTLQMERSVIVKQSDNVVENMIIKRGGVA